MIDSLCQIGALTRLWNESKPNFFGFQDAVVRHAGTGSQLEQATYLAECVVTMCGLPDEPLEEKSCNRAKKTELDGHARHDGNDASSAEAVTLPRLSRSLFSSFFAHAYKPEKRRETSGR